MALLQSFSNITRATRHAAQNILSHPLAKPIVPHLPDPVRSLVNANGEWEWGSWVEKGGVGEFESARVYLARWARIVAEEGERARRKEAQALPASSSDTVQEDSSLGIFELLHSTANLPTPKSTRDPSHPVDEKMWQSWFDKAGKPIISSEEMRREVFRRGISPKGTLRQKVWPFVLGVLEWDVTAEKRGELWQAKMLAIHSPCDVPDSRFSEQKYHEVTDEWCGVPEVFDSPKVLEVGSFICVRGLILISPCRNGIESMLTVGAQTEVSQCSLHPRKYLSPTSTTKRHHIALLRHLAEHTRYRSTIAKQRTR